MNKNRTHSPNHLDPQLTGWPDYYQGFARGLTRGFTLVELMITLAVIGITAAVTLPQMSQMTQSNKMTEQINMLSRDIAYARNEAVSRGERINVVSNGGTTWENGWGVFVNATGAQLRQTPAFATNNITLTETTGAGGIAGTIQFRPDGTTDNSATVKLCDPTNTNVGKQITLSPVGRVEIFNKTLRDGVTAVCP